MKQELHPRAKEVLEQAQRIFAAKPDFYKPTPSTDHMPSFFFGTDTDDDSHGL